LALGLAGMLGVVAIVGLPPATQSEPITTTIALSVFVLAALGCALPAWALVVRRLHDADLSGWMSLLTVLPYAGAILQIVFGMLPQKPLGERFDRR
jgi:uncharacterized membrane protein YhaH (DUF805 family)